ncbi:IDEAL domain-containing protein [Staphylococcus lutrae]|uniref:IDEAL domain protein n=1 Tax=Staphylococcus lutrae TaxID=155085 RepID=A0AAC9RPX2_9STAP|nr:IDEAL domain-containing protein [Staphylococcus lutrae]ARJ51471.1 IDEAL domain protein [Staphylococcus lutrae]PNZ38660.1 IDEAL domain-containing protein [Staphylococcus lutrae]
MKNQTDVKKLIVFDPILTIKQLGVEIVIAQALKNQRKQALRRLIDEALINKNERAFLAYTEEYLELEAEDCEQ